MTTDIKQQFRQAVLANAIADIGKGEEGKNNWGPYVQWVLGRFGIEEPAAWCAAAVTSWIVNVFRSCCYFDSISCTEKIHELYSTSAKAMFNAARELGWVLPPRELPQPGDLGITKRTAYDSQGNIIDWLAHAFVVEKTETIDLSYNGIPSAAVTVKTIEGNVGAFPAKVRRFTSVYNISKNRLEYGDRTNELHGWIRLLGRE